MRPAQSEQSQPRRGGITVGHRCAEWPRSMVRIEMGAAGSLGRQLTFHFPDGGTIEMEGLRGMGQYERMNDAFYAALGFVAAS